MNTQQSERIAQAEKAAFYQVLGATEAAHMRLKVVLDKMRLLCGREPSKATTDWGRSQPQMQHGRECFDDLVTALIDYPTCWDEAEMPEMPDELRRRVQEKLAKAMNQDSARR